MADMALRSVNVDCMLRCNAIELLLALLNDPSLRVQQNAALAIGRLADNSHEAARIAIFLDVLPALLKNIEKRSVSLLVERDHSIGVRSNVQQQLYLQQVPGV